MTAARLISFPIVLLALTLAGPPDSSAHQDIDLQVSALTQKIAEQPGNPDLYHRRADLHRAHEEFALALADYDRALALAPDLAGSHIGRSATLLATARPKQALASADRASELAPDSAEAHLSRARALAAIGDPPAADKAYIRSIALHQRPSPELFIEHATALRKQSPPDLDRANEVLSAGIAAAGPIVTLVSPAIDLHLESGNAEAALALVDRLPPSLANSPNWLVRRAKILATLGRTSLAHQTYRAAYQSIARLPERRRKTAAMTDLLQEIQESIDGLKRNAPPRE